MVKQGSQNQTSVQNDDQQLQEVQQQLQAKDEAYKRALADFKNLQQRVEQERGRLIQMAAAGLIEELLPALDHLELALQHFTDPSLKIIADELRSVLQRHGLQVIEVVGQTFDHATMEAIDTAPGPKDEVLQVRKAGYRLNGNVIRHAQVVVGSGAQ